MITSYRLWPVEAVLVNELTSKVVVAAGCGDGGFLVASKLSTLGGAGQFKYFTSERREIGG